MSDDTYLEIQSGGLLKLPPQVLRQMRAPVGTRFGLIPAGENLAILFRDNESAPEMRAWLPHCTFVGLIGSFGIADLFSTINMSQKSGVLVFESGPVSKRVFFDHGEVVFSESNDPEHRLGELLVKRGKLSRQQLDAIVGEKHAGVRLGAFLVQRGHLTAKDLYETVRHQVEEIIYSIFPMSSGCFYFFEGGFLAEDLSQFRLNTQNILMEGYRRLDEWGLMREKIPHDGVVLHVSGDAPDTGFESPHMDKVFRLIDGKRSVRELMRGSGLGEFDVTRAIYDLLRRGVVEAIDPKAVKDDKTKSLDAVIEAYNRLFLVVAQALDRAGRADAVGVQGLEDFVQGLDERARKILEGVQFDLQHGFAAAQARLLANMEKLSVGSGARSKVTKIAGLGDMFKRQQLQGVLDEVLNYLLFTLKNALPPDQADTFIQKVRAAHRRLRETRS